jgi:hypothetical protein
MAEEVKIVDVAGGPAAEATLQELLKVMKAGGGSGGGGGKSAAAATKAQDLYTSSVTRGTKTRKTNTKAVEASTSAFGKMSSALGSIGGGVGAAFGGLIGIAKNFGTAMTQATTIGGVLEAVPVFGSVLGQATGYFQSSVESFRQLSEVGAGFGNDMMAIRSASAEAGLSLDQFSSMIAANADRVGLLGSTSGEGAARMGRMTKQLRSQEAGLLSLGFTQESVNEGFGDYIEMMARSGQLRGRSDASLTAGAQNYLMEIDKLAKVTGKSRKEIQDEMNSRMAAANFNVLASKLTGDALTNFTTNAAFDKTLGDDFADAMTDLADGTAQSGFAQKLASIVPGFADLAEANATGKISQEEYQRRFRELLPQIQSFASGLDAAGTSALMQEDGYAQLLATLSPAQKELQRMTDAAKADADQDKRTNLTDTFATFEQTIQNVKSKFETALIDSGILDTVGTLMGDLGTGITTLADDGVKWFADYLKSESFQLALTNFKDSVESMKTKITTFVDDIGKVGFAQAIKNLFASEDGKGIDIGGMFGDFLSSAFANMLPSLDTVLIGLAVGIGAMILAPFAGIAAVFVGIGVGIAAMIGWEKIKQFAVDSWNAITGVFTGIVDWFAGVDIMTPINDMWATVKGWFTFGEGESFSISAVGTKMWETVTGWFSMEGTDFSISAVADMMWQTVTGWFNFLDTTFSISEIATNMWNTVTGWFGFGEGEAAFGISQLAQDAWATVTGWFGFGEGDSFSISELISGAWETVTGFFSFGDMELPSISGLFQGIIDKVKGFFSFDFKMPNFKQYLPTWLGGEGKSLFGGGGSEPGTAATAAVTQPEAMPDVSTPGNVAALGTLDYGYQLDQAKLLKTELADISSMATFNDELERMQSGLDKSNVEAYNTSMKALVTTLEKLNKVLAEDNKGLLGGGTGVSAGSMLADGTLGGGSSTGSAEQLDRLNSLVTQLIALQGESNTNTKNTVKAISGNLQLG